MADSKSVCHKKIEARYYDGHKKDRRGFHDPSDTVMDQLVAIRDEINWQFNNEIDNQRCYLRPENEERTEAVKDFINKQK